MKKEIYKVAIISPNDVLKERKMISITIEQLNIGLSETEIGIEVKKWETAKEGISKTEVQSLIDEDLNIQQCDIVICIFGMRIGTQYFDEESNTVHELNNAIKSFQESGAPQILVYFKKCAEIPLGNLNKLQIANYSKLMDYKEKLQADNRIFYKEYQNIKDLEVLVRERLTKHYFAKKDIVGVNVSDFASNLVLVEKTLEGYLKLLAKLISETEDEVLFTSTRMSDSNDLKYGKSQKNIIAESMKFQKRNTKRIHYGIIDSSFETLNGATELRLNVDDIILKFSSLVPYFRFNFFVSDNKRLVIRLKGEDNSTEYTSLYFENAFLANLLRDFFFETWDKSTFMHEYFNNTFENNRFIKDPLLRKYFNRNEVGLNSFLKKIQNIDEVHYSIPVTTKRKSFIVISKLPEALLNVSGSINNLKSYCESLISDKKLTVNDLQNVRKSINNHLKINYDKLGDSFSFQYFYANYLKVKHSMLNVVNYIGLTDNMTVLDLGGGGGASISASIDFFENQKKIGINYHIVDNCKNQIDIAKIVLRDNSSRISYFEDDISSFLMKNQNNYDFIVASNVLCEYLTSSNHHESIKNIINALKENGRLLVVERTESGIYDFFMNMPNLNLMAYKFKNERFTIPSDFISTSFSQFDPTSIIKYGSFIKTEYTLRYALYEKSNS